jgi:predicted aspartyl protease
MPKKRCQRCQRIRWVAIFVVLAAMLMLLMISSANAEVYKYVDESGRKIFVGSLSQVPEKYKDQIEVQSPSGMVSNVTEFSKNTQKAATSIRQLMSERQLSKALSQLETPVVIHRNQVLVPVTVTYHGYSAQVTMLMDTGASSTVFHDDALARLEPQQTEAGYARVAGGGIVRLSQIEFDVIEIGPYKAKKARSLVIKNKQPNSGFDGLLGMDFLINVDYELDKQRSVIIWNPKRYQELKDVAKSQLSEDTP